MYIDLNIIYVLLAILGCVALGYLIVTLRSCNKLLKNANELVVENKRSINESISKLPNVVSNFDCIGENVKDVTEVVTDVTADFIVKKENMKSNIQVITDIFEIIRSVLGR